MLDKIKNLKEYAKDKNPIKKDGDQYIVAVDVGTEFIKTLIGRVTELGVEIIGVGRAHQSLGDMQAGAISDIGAVVANCDKALAEAEAQAGVSARTAMIGIAGELVKGTTTTVRVRRRDANEPIGVEEIDRIIKIVQDRAQEVARRQLAWELGGKKVEIKLVNSALVDIEIDGYRVTNPMGFQGKDVVVQLYTAFAPLVHIGALERTAQELDLDLLAVAAEPFAVARSVIGDDASANMSAILMDVGGGTTDIAVINDGGVQGTKMFGIGGRAYTRSIERELDITFEKAEELKLGEVESVPAKDKAEMDKALQKTVDVWVKGVELALGEFTKLDSLPQKLLLCGGGASLGILEEALSDSDWYKKLPFTKKPKVQLINPRQVVGIIDKTGQVNDHTYITTMGLLRVGLDTLQQEKEKPTGSVKERINRILKV